MPAWDEDNDLGWHFNGDSVFYGVIDGLLEDHGMDEAEEIIVSGASASAEGLFNQMDYLADYLAEKAPNARVRFAYNNGWHLSYIENYDPDALGDEQSREKMYLAWRPVLNEGCEADHPDDPWMCFYTGDILYPYHRTKNFHEHYHQFDSHSLETYGLEGSYQTWNESQMEFAIACAETYIESFYALNPETSWSSPACTQHDNFDKMEWDSECMESDPENFPGVYDYNISHIIYDWWENDYYIKMYDACMEPNCNPTCRP